MYLTVTKCHFILLADYCQCHTTSITNSQRSGRLSLSQQLITMHYNIANTSV